MELLLTDAEAEHLTRKLKELIKKYNIDLSAQPKGILKIRSNDGKDDFLLNYFYSSTKKVVNFRHAETNYTLVRINLSSNFHKNADGTKIQGNRINIFSEDEFYEKNDGQTHYRCYPLPYENIENTDDFVTVLFQLLSFTNTIVRDKINIVEQLELFERR